MHEKQTACLEAEAAYVDALQQMQREYFDAAVSEDENKHIGAARWEASIDLWRELSAKHALDDRRADLRRAERAMVEWAFAPTTDAQRARLLAAETTPELWKMLVDLALSTGGAS